MIKQIVQKGQEFSHMLYDMEGEIVYPERNVNEVLFLVINGTNPAMVYRVNEVTKSFNNGRITILQEVDVEEKTTTYREAFFFNIKKTSFQIDDGPAFEGYTFGRHWNGWDCPYFTKETGLEIAKWGSTTEEGYEYFEIVFDEETDTFYAKTEKDQKFKDCEEFWKGEDLITNLGPLHVYSIGSWSWIWDEA